MSAVLILTQRERLSVFADAAAYTPDGVLRVIRSKLIILDEPGCVLVLRGHTPGRKITWQPPATFDGVKAALPDLAKSLATAAQEDHAQENVAIEIVTAGVSEFNGDLEAWGTCTAAQGEAGGVGQLPGYSPGLCQRLPATWGAPGWSEAEVPTFGDRWRGVAREEIDPEAFGRDAVCAARCSTRWEDDASTTVGGFLEMTQVTRTGVTCRTLGYWPDTVGERPDRLASFCPLPHVTENRGPRAMVRRAA